MVPHRRQLLVSVGEQCSSLLGGRKAKRVTLWLVVVDQRAFEEFRKRPIDVVTRERAPAKLTECDVDPVLGGRLVGIGGKLATDVETVAFERREMGPRVRGVHSRTSCF